MELRRLPYKKHFSSTSGLTSKSLKERSPREGHIYTHSLALSQSHSTFYLKRTPVYLVDENSEAMEVKVLGSGLLGNCHPPSTHEEGILTRLFWGTSRTTICQGVLRKQGVSRQRGFSHGGTSHWLLSAACTSPLLSPGQGQRSFKETIPIVHRENAFPIPTLTFDLRDSISLIQKQTLGEGITWFYLTWFFESESLATM